jgi:integrase
LFFLVTLGVVLMGYWRIPFIMQFCWLGDEEMAKRPNGTGCITKLKFRDKETGDTKESRFWYILYSVNGKQKRESAETEDYQKAKDMLALRMGEHALGMKPTVDVKAIKYEDVKDAYLDQARKDGVTFFQKADGKENLPGMPNLDEFFAGRRVLDITSDVLRAYTNHRTKAGVQGPTIRRELVTLRAMLRLAHKEGKLRLADIPHFPMPADSKPRKGFVNPDLFAQLRDKLPAHLRPLITFLYCTGCRIGAARKITWEMVNADATEMELPGDITKNGEPLTLPLVGYGLDELSTMLKKMFRTPGPVFDDTNLRKEWAEACHNLKLGIKDGWRYQGLKIHDLRRSAVRNLIRGGARETVAMTISGHKTRSVFDRYNITDTSDVRDALIKRGEYAKIQERRARATMPKRAKGNRG